MRRRTFVKTLSALAVPAVTAPRLFAAETAVPAGLKHIGTPQPFDYAWLKGHARALAGKAYQANSRAIPDAVKNLNWDQYQAIRYRAEAACSIQSGTVGSPAKIPRLPCVSAQRCSHVMPAGPKYSSFEV